MRHIVLISSFIAAFPVSAAESISYTYDALGRLTATATSGGVNNGVAGTIGYDPAGNRSSYTIGGSAGGGTPTPPSNQPPVAVNDSGSGACNVPKTINVVANDYDPDGNTPLTLVSVTPGANTEAKVSSSTSLLVTGYVRGSEYIYYVVRDSLGAATTGRLTYTTTGTDQQCFA